MFVEFHACMQVQLAFILSGIFILTGIIFCYPYSCYHIGSSHWHSGCHNKGNKLPSTQLASVISLIRQHVFTSKAHPQDSSIKHI